MSGGSASAVFSEALRLSSADTLATAMQVVSHTRGRLASSSVFPKEGFSETNQFRSEKMDVTHPRSGSLGGGVVRK